MNLQHYMDKHETSVTAVSAELGCTPQSISYYLSGKRLPNKEMMQKIFQWSGGQVAPNDFYEVTDVCEITDVCDIPEYPETG